MELQPIGLRTQRLGQRESYRFAVPSVTKLVTNLPWGIKSGSHAQNRRLYPQMLAEFRRVLAPGGTMVLLTAETHLMREVLAREHLRPTRIFNVTILGASAAVYVCAV